MKECSYTIPVLENADKVCYWSFSGSSDENPGNCADKPKKTIGSIAAAVRDGGTIIPSGKGYISASVSLSFDGVVKFSAVSTDGRDYREEKAEFGAVIWEGGATLSICSDVIFDKVNIYSRKATPHTLKITGNSTALFSDVKFRVQNSAYEMTRLHIDEGSTVIFMGDNVGSVSAVSGCGVLVADKRLVECGKLTKQMIEGFDGIVCDLDYQPLAFPAETGKEKLHPSKEYLSGSFTDSKGTTIPYRYYLPKGYDESREYPIVLYMHGNGSRGSDNEKQLLSSGAALHDKIFRSKYDCILLAPQCPTSSMWSDIKSAAGSAAFLQREMGTYLSAANELYDKFVAEYSVDKDRQYAMGTSCGGAALWELMYNYPGKFTAVIPIAGALQGDGAAGYAKVGVGDTVVWTFHGTADTTCNVEGTRALVRELTALGRDVTYTEVKGATHANVWIDAAEEVGIVDWLFSQKKIDKVAGDIDRDEHMTHTDVAMLLRHLSGEQIDNADCADMNGDGKLTNADAVAMIKKLRGFED